MEGSTVWVVENIVKGSVAKVVGPDGDIEWYLNLTSIVYMRNDISVLTKEVLCLVAST